MTALTSQAGFFGGQNRTRRRSRHFGGLALTTALTTVAFAVDVAVAVAVAVASMHGLLWFSNNDHGLCSCGVVVGWSCYC